MNSNLACPFDWREVIIPSMRTHISNIILSTLVPQPQTIAANDFRLLRVFDAVIHYENEAFSLAIDTDDYFKRISRHIVDIRQTLDGRCQLDDTHRVKWFVEEISLPSPSLTPAFIFTGPELEEKLSEELKYIAISYENVTQFETIIQRILSEEKTNSSELLSYEQRCLQQGNIEYRQRKCRFDNSKCRVRQLISLHLLVSLIIAVQIALFAVHILFSSGKISPVLAYIPPPSTCHNLWLLSTFLLVFVYCELISSIGSTINDKTNMYWLKRVRFGALLFGLTAIAVIVLVTYTSQQPPSTSSLSWLGYLSFGIVAAYSHKCLFQMWRNNNVWK